MSTDTDLLDPDQWRPVTSVPPTTEPTDQPTPTKPADIVLTPTQKGIVGAVTAGAVLIATLGFIGSYNAVVKLAARKGFGAFAHAFPIAIDAGIGVLLALDLLLTWLRMPYPVLRHVAWTLTGATIAFNAATAWGDNLAVGMHAAIPVLFVVIVEAARHTVGRIANITADRHIEGPPLKRWILSPVPTYRIWRRQQLWHLTSYTEVVAIEWEARIYRSTLRFRYGRSWRRNAQIHELLALKLARLGQPVHRTLADYAADLAVPLAPEADTAGANTTPPAGVALATPAANNSAEPGDNPAPATAATWRQEPDAPVASTGTELATTGASDTPATGDNSTAKNTANWRQNPAPAGASNTPAAGAKSPRQLATGSPRRTIRVAATAKKPSRRPMDEWVNLAGPVFHDEFQRLHRQPTGEEFAAAIEKAKLGTVSASTAKNIRTRILDETPLPALD